MDGSGKKIPMEIIDGFVTRMKLPNAKYAFMSTLLGLKNSDLITEKLESISSPTLIIWGTEFLSSIKNCHFYEMHGCGHTPYVQEPEKFASYVLKFLND